METAHDHEYPNDPDAQQADRLPDPVPFEFKVPDQRRAGLVATLGVLGGLGILAVASGSYVFGRASTRDERASLRNARDDAVVELERASEELGATRDELSQSTFLANAHEATIDQLRKQSVTSVAEIRQLRSDLDEAAQVTSELWEHLDEVAICSNLPDAAQSALAQWDATWRLYDEFMITEVGSDDEAAAWERVDAALTELDLAEDLVLTESTRCTTALESVPECTADRTEVEAARDAIVVDGSATCLE
jgi:hypothetical protein